MISLYFLSPDDSVIIYSRILYQVMLQGLMDKNLIMIQSLMDQEFNS